MLSHNSLSCKGNAAFLNALNIFLSGFSILIICDYNISQPNSHVLLVPKAGVEGRLSGGGSIFATLTGAQGRGRTGTMFPPRDFKSLASANSATRAIIIVCFILSSSPNPSSSGFNSLRTSLRDGCRSCHRFAAVSPLRLPICWLRRPLR